MILGEIKLAIWHHRKVHKNPIDLQLAADAAQVRLPITQVHEAEKLLNHLNKRAKKSAAYVSDEAFRRYRDAKFLYQSKEFVNWIADGHFIEPDRPKDDTNGLTGFIVDFLTWSGHFANRTGNEGRVIKNKAGKEIRIKSSSKKGMQDVDANLKHSQHKFGIPWKIEVKAGKDTHKDHQKEYGAKVAATGGYYSVVKSADDLLAQYDKLMMGNCEQSSIFDEVNSPRI